MINLNKGPLYTLKKNKNRNEQNLNQIKMKIFICFVFFSLNVL
jgi:hypothetical protein